MAPDPPGDVSFRRFHPAEAHQLADFLAGEPWPWHAGPPAAPEAVIGEVDRGGYESESERTFWVVEGDAPVGIVRVFDIGHGDPMFDLRLTAAARGRGIGTTAVRWLTDHLFDELAGIDRIEATTRQDNVAMRRVLGRCGFAKEAHYRRAWSTASGDRLASIGYAILRPDWESGSVTPVDWDDEPGAR